MTEWASYSLHDLLLFSPGVYFRLYELNNAALWPLPVAMILIALALIALAVRKDARLGGVIGTLLALSWVIVAWWFFYQRYAQINMAATWFSIGFAMQALMLFVAGIAGSLDHDRTTRRFTTNLGALLLTYAVMVHPLVSILPDRPLGSMELFGLAPDPPPLPRWAFC